MVCTPTASGSTVTFSIVGGMPGLLYDVFATGGFAGPLTNAQWAWLGQWTNCATYSVANMPTNQCFLILGKPQDTDFDGLTDSYELLVSHTDPTKPDTSGDGMLDGWKVMYGLNPLINNAAQTSQRNNYSYDLDDWLYGLTGVKSETLTNDAEGNVLTNSQ